MITDNSAKSTDFPSHDGTAQHPKGLKAVKRGGGRVSMAGNINLCSSFSWWPTTTVGQLRTRKLGKRGGTQTQKRRWCQWTKDGKTVKKTLAKLYKFSYSRKIVILLNRNIILTRKLRPEKCELIRKISKHRIRNKNSHGSTKVDGEIGSRRWKWSRRGWRRWD